MIFIVLGDEDLFSLQMSLSIMPLNMGVANEILILALFMREEEGTMNFLLNWKYTILGMEKMQKMLHIWKK
jgi:hypothetical protein